MSQCPQHTFQILTKRSKRLKEVSSELEWPKNVWMGVSVENKKTIYRIKDLQQVPSEVRFISFEPLLSDLGHFSLKKYSLGYCWWGIWSWSQTDGEGMGDINFQTM